MDKHNLLHPPFQVKKLKNNDKVLLINYIKDGKFDVGFLDAHFRKFPKHMDVPVKDLSKFLDSPDCQSLKAVFFALSDRDNISNFVNFEIRQMVYEEVRKRKWYIYLFHPKLPPIMSMLFASKIDSKPGDAILNVLSLDQMVRVSEVRRKQKGYSYIGDQSINRFNRNINDVAAECLGTCDPKYVIVIDPVNTGLVTSLKSRVVPSKNVINIDTKRFGECTPQAMKTIFEHGYNQYNQITPFTMDVLAVTNESNFIDPQQAVITVDDYEELPLEKTKVVPKSKNSYYVSYLDKVFGRYEPAGKTQHSKEQNGHRIKLALVVDSNSLPFLYQEPFVIPEIQALPQKLLLSKAVLNAPVIGFFDNSSVICVRDENGYRFLNEWNGKLIPYLLQLTCVLFLCLYGNDLCLSFEQEKPVIVTDLNEVNDKDPFLVYDLIKILSMPQNDLKADPKWGFKVISDAENPVLLEIDTFSGSRKATPLFLMALILKHHIKAIKNATGKKPKELGFCLFNEFTAEEKNRIHTCLEEVCKLMKIGFVSVDHF